MTRCGLLAVPASADAPDVVSVRRVTRGGAGRISHHTTPAEIAAVKVTATAYHAAWRHLARGAGATIAAAGDATGAIACSFMMKSAVEMSPMRFLRSLCTQPLINEAID